MSRSIKNYIPKGIQQHSEKPTDICAHNTLSKEDQNNSTKNIPQNKSRVSKGQPEKGYRAQFKFQPIL